jgi:AraC-like DNA-binding protein
VFVINGKLRHGYKDVHDLHLVNIMFDPRHFLGETDHVKKLPGYHVLFSLEPKFRHKHQFESRLRLSPDQLDRLLTFVDDLESELENHEPGYEYMVTATFMLVVGYLCRCYAGSSHPASRSLIRIGEVISFLERHYEEPITLDHLQEIVGMSSSVLLRTFRDATGYSPIEYLIRLRIARSCKLLRNSDMAVTETAFRVGFSDSNYFARQFKRVMGTSPTSYRKKAHVL